MAFSLPPGYLQYYGIQRKQEHTPPDSEPNNGVTPGAEAAVAAAATSSGSPLPDNLQGRFAESLGTDLSGVRVHTEAASAGAAASVNARAYTVGNDIHFAAGQYDPSSPDGQHLIAHEVAHTVQQAGAAPRAQAKLEVSQPGDHEEREADRAAELMVRPAPAVHDGEARRPQATPEVQVGRGTLARSVVQRDTWGSSYQGATGSYDSYKGSLPTTGATSDSKKGTQTKGEITRDDLLTIFTGVKADLAKYKKEQEEQQKKAAASGQPPVVDPDKLNIDEIVTNMVGKLNAAFRLMRIDTVEAQATYLANAFVESDQFRYMTETQRFQKGNRAYETDPTRVKPLKSWLDEAKTGQVRQPDGTFLQVTGYQKGGEVNPNDDGWEKSFIGRGPVQVTNRTNYIHTLAELEHRAEELEKGAADANNPNKDRDADDAKTLRAAVSAIKADPAQAANPQYAFLFSAGYMKMMGGDVKASGGDRYSWMGAQPKKAEKDAAYFRALPVLKQRKAEADNNAPAPAAPSTSGAPAAGP